MYVCIFAVFVYNNVNNQITAKLSIFSDIYIYTLKKKGLFQLKVVYMRLKLFINRTVEKQQIMRIPQQGNPD